MLILTIQEDNSMVISNAQPNVQSKILNISQPFASINFNITSGAVSNIDGIVELYVWTGGTGPGFIVARLVALLP